MALYYPSLPSGTHPYNFVMKSPNGNIYLFSSDLPFCTKSATASTPVYSAANYWIYKLVSDSWVSFSSGGANVAASPDGYGYFASNIIYSNHDILCGTYVSYAKTPEPTAIQLPTDSMKMLKGMVWDLPTTVLPAGASQLVSFESSNPSICTVDKYGHITCLEEGNCTITIATR